MDNIAGEPGKEEGSPRGHALGLLCHELRQPLVVAVGYVSMLEDGAFGELPDEARPILRIVSDRLRVLNQIVDSMVDEASGSSPAPAAGT